MTISAATLFGGGGGGGNSMPGQLLFNSLTKTQAQQFEAFQKEPLIERDLNYFMDNIGKVETAEELLDDYRLKKFVLEAFGLEEDLNKDAFIERILTDDLEGEDALAYRMVDNRYAELATALRLDTGNSILQDTGAMGELAARWLVNSFEKDMGEQNANVREAMYFRRKAPDIANMYQILGDKALREVVMTVSGLPAQMVNQPIEKQAEALESKINLDEFKDPDYVDNLMRQYLAIKDAENGANTIDSGIVNLFQPIGSGGGINLLV